MPELVGEHHYQLDPKGRITFPAKFRAAFVDGVFLTLGQDGCLYAFPPEEWQLRASDAKGLPLSDPKSRAYARMFFANAEQAELDSQGRLTIPQTLRVGARLQGEVTVIGVNDRLEIWAAEEWARYQQENAESYASGELVPGRA